MTIVLASASPRRRELLEMLAGTCELLVSPAEGGRIHRKEPALQQQWKHLLMQKRLKLPEKDSIKKMK